MYEENQGARPARAAAPRQQYIASKSCDSNLATVLQAIIHGLTTTAARQERSPWLDSLYDNSSGSTQVSSSTAHRRLRPRRLAHHVNSYRLSVARASYPDGRHSGAGGCRLRCVVSLRRVDSSPSRRFRLATLTLEGCAKLAMELPFRFRHRHSGAGAS